MSRVLVIDDHPIVLQGVRQLLEDAGDNQITQALTLAEGSVSTARTSQT